MIIYKEENIKTLVPKETICDKCLKPKEDLIEIRYQYGYGSDKDGDYIETDLCIDCFEKIIEKEDIKVRTFTDDITTEFDGMV